MSQADKQNDATEPIPEGLVLEPPQVISAEELMEKVEDDKTVRVNDFNVPFKREICLYDFAINSYDQNEDKVYAFDGWYRTYIRRGNTVIKVSDSSKKVLESFYGRKGFEKFFDLHYEYIQYNLKEIADFNGFALADVDMHYNMYDIVFQEAYKGIEDHKKIALYKLVKANGENAQVSWVKSLDAWLIASKNVSLLARNEQDAQSYKAQRFKFARLIAKEWFKVIEKMNNDGLLNELKEYMDGKTFVGEYCGNQAYQHLTKYTEINIYFVAIVENNSIRTCLPPPEVFAVFEKYKLTHVNYQDMGVYDSWTALNQALKEVYANVSKASIESEEEGSVVYIVETDKEGKHHTLSLSKLKTLEYRIYRKLREKLRNFISQKGDNYRPWNDFYAKFREEVEGLCIDFQPPLPLDYYFNIAAEAFMFGETYHSQSSLIHDQYITFLSLLLYCVGQNQKLTPAYFTEESIQKVLLIPWAEHYSQYNAIEKKAPIVIPSVEEVIPIQKAKTYVIVPVGIPGMGKTYLLNTFRKLVEGNSCEFSMLSSDEVRKECMDKLSKRNKKLKFDELYDRTGKDARNLFNDRLVNLISTSDQKKTKAHFIFVDKNHPPNAFKGTIDLIKNNGAHLDLEIIALTPLIGDKVLTYEEQGKAYEYPFSTNFFFHCLDRVQGRKDHPTLPGGGVKTLGILIMFLHMYRNIQLNHESLLRSGFNRLLQVPFTNEASPATISSELMEVLFEVLKATKPGNMCNEKNLIERMNQIFEKERIQFKDPDPTLVEQCTEKFFNEEIIPNLPTFDDTAAEPIDEEKPTMGMVVKSEKIVDLAEEEGHIILETEKRMEKPAEQMVDETLAIFKSVESIVEKQVETITEEITEAEKLIENLIEKCVDDQKGDYKPDKIPLYLGLFATTNPAHPIREYVIKGLQYLVKVYPQDELLTEELGELEQGASAQLQMINDIHITTLFIGKDQKKTQTDYFKTFSPGFKMDLQICGMVIVPGKIATGICYPDQSVIKIENKFPHVTLMKGQWAPKVSNEMLEAIFGGGGPLEKNYRDKELIHMQEFSYKTNVKTRNGQKGTAYVVKTPANLEIKLVAKTSDDA